MEIFKELDCEVDLLLMSLREFHTYSVVEFVGGAILEAIKDKNMLKLTAGTNDDEMMKGPLATCLSISLDELLCKNNLLFRIKIHFFSLYSWSMYYP